MRPIDAYRLKAVLEKNFGHTGGASVLEQLIDEQPTIEPSTNCSEIPNSSDTISRQAAIDAIVQCTNCGDEDTLREYVLKHSLDNGWTGGILEALDAVKDLPPAQLEPHWIPVSERLPEKGVEYLVSVHHTIGAISVFHPEKDTYVDDVAIMKYYGKFPSTVRAWMPLPEAYKPNK